MYGVDMYYSVKTLSERGKSNLEIAEILGIHRNTVSKIKKKINNNEPFPTKVSRKSSLEVYKDKILEYLELDLSAVLIHEKLQEKYNLKKSYGAVRDYVKKLKGSECYIPLISPPGKEGQVDFGYVGRFNKDGKHTKTWSFCMVLGSSRYPYYEFVTNQTTETFIKCHINAFEYFGGVPETIKIDNLKSGVLQASFYEPVFQEEYNNFLNHYGTSGITCRIRRGQDKGKVESGIKYVKNNFIKGLETKDYYEAQEKLKEWTLNKCSTRIHGTTRKVPKVEFLEKEKEKLQPLPLTRYEIFKVETRKVNNYGHVFYKNNHYSVPYEYKGQVVSLKTNGKILKIYDNTEEIAMHGINHKEGEFITTESHKPPYKQKKESAYYEAKAMEVGINVYDFAKIAKKQIPNHWQKILLGVLSLTKTHSKETVDKACKRAIHYNVISYRSVKEIIQNGLYNKEIEQVTSVSAKGFATDLSYYDKLLKLKGKSYVSR